MSDSPVCSKEAIIAALEQEARYGVEHRKQIKESIDGLKGEITRAFDLILNGGEGGLISKLKLLENDLIYTKTNIAVIKNELFDRLDKQMVTKQDFFVGKQVGFTVGKVALWILIVLIALSGGIMLPF